MISIELWLVIEGHVETEDLKADNRASSVHQPDYTKPSTVFLTLSQE